MRLSDLERRMWAEALEVLERAERLQRQFFLPSESATSRSCWAPPADVFETPDSFVVLLALPDVDPTGIRLAFENGSLSVAGERRLPGKLSGATIRRLEIPQGRFERQIALAARSIERSEFKNGCLMVILAK